MIYKNTRHAPLRLNTSNGVIVLDGFAEVTIDEDISTPYWVEKRKEKVTRTKPTKPAAEKAAKTPTTRKRRTKKAAAAKPKEQ